MNCRMKARLINSVIISSLVTCCTLLYIQIVLFYKSRPEKPVAMTTYPAKPSTSKSEFHERRLGCLMPTASLPVFPPLYENEWKPSFQHNCSYEQQILKLQDEQTFTVHPSLGQNCCHQQVIRGSSDANYSFSACKPVATIATVENETIYEPIEFNDASAFFLYCDKSINADVSLAATPGVAEKLNFWEGTSEEERPYSVFILGIDTVSRSHAYRSLPKTLKLLKDLGFYDFDSFHAVAANTLSNLMGLLGGFTKEDFHRKCVKDWRSNFDSCKLIWKEFGIRNYVTSYIEDGYQSFNWGGKSGFLNPPTDYYWHHFFLALEEVRRHQFQKFNIPAHLYSQDCTSSETIPEFLLRYSSRFMNKFAGVPSFLMSWLANPFHDDIYALETFDSALHQFFSSLSTKPEILRKTLIIFLSDHGDRFSSLSGKSVESFIERANPMLFIRLPESLQSKHPEMSHALVQNSKKFTTPFDLHVTLHNLIHLEQDFQVGSDPVNMRSSLFVPINKDRSCADANIPLMTCLCNIEYNPASTSSVLAFENAYQLMDSVVGYLNAKIQASKYASDCVQWISDAENIVYTNEIGHHDGKTELLIAFTAEPGDAQFEARILVPTQGDLIMDNVNFIGLSRTSRYRDQSWCVGYENNIDKEMKELCFCKDPPPMNYTQNFIEKFYKLMR